MTRARNPASSEICGWVLSSGVYRVSFRGKWWRAGNTPTRTRRRFQNPFPWGAHPNYTRLTTYTYNQLQQGATGILDPFDSSGDLVAFSLSTNLRARTSGPAGRYLVELRW